MECPECCKSYQEGECEPYILVGCGHSLCLNCIEKQSVENTADDSQEDTPIKKVNIVCPECKSITQAESLNQLPKNFSLLNMIKSSLTARTLPVDRNEEMGEEMGVGNDHQSLTMQNSADNNAQPDDQKHSDDKNFHQSMSDYNSMINYDQRTDFLESVDVVEQISQGGQGDQSGARDYQRVDLLKNDTSDKLTIQSGINMNDLDGPFDDQSISVKMSKDGMTSKAESRIDSGKESNQNEGAGSSTPESKSQYECEAHGKGIQGYCATDKQVLCIDCILSGTHKNHEICPIDKAAKDERNNLTVKFQKSKVIEDLVSSSLVKAKNHQESLRTQTFEYKNKIQQIFQEIRFLIDEKEKSMVSDVDSKLQKEIKYLSNRDKDGQNQLKIIDKFQKTWNELGELPDEQLLINIKDSYAEAEKALAEPKQIKHNQIVSKVNKDQEVAQLTKYILNSANQVSLPPSFGQLPSAGQPHATPEVQSSKFAIAVIEKEPIITKKSKVQPQPVIVKEQQDKDKDVDKDLVGKDANDAKQGGAFKRATQRRESTFKAPGSSSTQAKQITQRSSSTRPGNFNFSEPNSSSQVTNNLQKASYMQATSSWAKRKIENEKQRDEINTKKTIDRSKYQNPKGFTSSTNSQQNSMSAFQPDSGAKPRENVSTNLMRNQRLASKDRKITTPFQHTQTFAEKQNSGATYQPLSQAPSQSGYNSTQKPSGSPTSQPNEYNQLGKVNKSAKPDSSEKKRKGKPVLMPNVQSQSNMLKTSQPKHTQSITTNVVKQNLTDSLTALGTNTQSHNNLASIAQSQPKPNQAMANKSEKLHFMKPRQRMPVLKETNRASSRMAMDPSERDINKSQLSHRNRSQTRTDDKSTDIAEKQASGAMTAPNTGVLGRKKQTWLQRTNTNTIAHNYNFEQNETKSNNAKKKNYRASNQSVDNDTSSPLQSLNKISSKLENNQFSTATYMNSFQRAAEERKKQLEGLRNSEDPVQEQSNDEKYLLNLNLKNSGKAMPAMDSLAERRNQMKSKNLRTLDALNELPEMPETVSDITPKQGEQQLSYEQKPYGFNDTSYTRQITRSTQQQVQNISLESKMDQIQQQLDTQRMLKESTRSAQQMEDDGKPTQDQNLPKQMNYVSFNNSQQINMGGIQNTQSSDMDYRQQEDRFQQTQTIPVSQDNNFNDLDQNNKYLSEQVDGNSPLQVRERKSLPQNAQSPRNHSKVEPVQAPKTEYKEMQGSQAEDAGTGLKQTRQRWQTLKKQKSNGHIDNQMRGQSMSHVFIDDSQDNINIVPHNDTEYNYQPEEENLNIKIQEPPQLPRVDEHSPLDQFADDEAPNQLSDKPQKLNDLIIKEQKSSQHSPDRYTEPASSQRRLDFYPRIQNFVQSKEEYTKIQSARKAQTQSSNYEFQGPLSAKLVEMNEQIQNFKHMSFAPPTNNAGPQLDQYSLDQSSNQNPILSSQASSFINKYQTQYEAQADAEEDLQPQQFQPRESNKIEQIEKDLSMMKVAEKDLGFIRPSIASPTYEMNDEIKFSIFAISGYCDQPLHQVEKLALKYDRNSEQQAQRQNMDCALSDQESLCDGSEGQAWQPCAQLNIARTKFEAVVVPANPQAGRIKQQIWILGGKNSQSQRIDVIEMYDESANSWNIIPQIKMRKAKSGFASVLIHNEPKQLDQLMVIGGNDGQVQNRVEFMNLWDYQWHKCASMISRRDELAACLGPDGKIYAIGGYGGPTNSSCLRSVERYDPVKNKWEPVAQMNEGRRALAAVSMPDGIYAIGGYNGKDYISSVEKYDVETDSWTVVCHLNSPKCTMTAVAAPDQQRFYVIGGFNGTQLNEVEVFNIKTRTMRKFSYPMNMKRFMHSSAVLIC